MPTSVSALLRSAQARQNKIRDLEDSFAAYEYSRSAKTYQDYLDYARYIEDRAKTADPSKALTYQRTLDSARSGYISNEIQRQSIAVLEGRATNTDKYNAMLDLFYQARDAGDYDLVQRLNLQLDNLSVTIQNEQESAQRAASTLALNQVKSLKEFEKLIVKGTEEVTLADGRKVMPLAALDAELKANGETEVGYFQEALTTIKALRETVEAAYLGATTQEAVDQIEAKYGDILRGEATFETAAGKLTESEIELGYRSAAANNPLYSPEAALDETTGQTVYKLAKNKIDDFVWARMDDGSYAAVQTRAKVLDPLQDLDSLITDDGYFIQKTTDSKGVYKGGQAIDTSAGLSIKQRLANYGILAEGGQNGKVKVTTPEYGTFEAAIQPDGSIRFYGPQGQYSGAQAGLFEINVLNGQIREVAPDETSIFGTKSVFGGQLSKPSDAGKLIAASLAGGVRSPQELFGPSKITNIQNDFTGQGSPVIGGNLQGTTQILENAAQTRQAVLKEQQQANLLQPSQAFNLNQTPVQQFAQNGAPIRQLTVAPPAPTPTVKVSAPQPTKPITSVGVAQNVPRVSGVVQLPAQPKVTVR